MLSLKSETGKAATADFSHFVVFEKVIKSAEADDHCLGGFVRHSHPIYDQYRLLILEYKGSDSLDFENLAKCLGDQWEKVPLEYSGNTVIIPTDEILIRFRAKVKPEEISSFLRDHGLTSDTQEGDSVVVHTGRLIRELEEVVKKLLSSAIVESAEVNKVLIRIHE